MVTGLVTKLLNIPAEFNCPNLKPDTDTCYLSLSLILQHERRNSPALLMRMYSQMFSCVPKLVRKVCVTLLSNTSSKMEEEEPWTRTPLSKLRMRPPEPLLCLQAKARWVLPYPQLSAKRRRRNGAPPGNFIRQVVCALHPMHPVLNNDRNIRCAIRWCLVRVCFFNWNCDKIARRCSPIWLLKKNSRSRRKSLGTTNRTSNTVKNIFNWRLLWTRNGAKCQRCSAHQPTHVLIELCFLLAGRRSVWGRCRRPPSQSDRLLIIYLKVRPLWSHWRPS